jgi:hypothetical protein
MVCAWFAVTLQTGLDISRLRDARHRSRRFSEPSAAMAPRAVVRTSHAGTLGEWSGLRAYGPPAMIRSRGAWSIARDRRNKGARRDRASCASSATSASSEVNPRA